MLCVCHQIDIGKLQLKEMMMFDLYVENYRGSLHAKEENGKYYWAVECDMDSCEEWTWSEIPKHLFDALALYSQSDDS